MKSFFKFAEKNSKKPGKLVIVFLLVLMSFSFLVIQPKQVQAQAIVFDSFNAALKAGDNIFQKTANAFKYLWQKGGSMAFQQTLRTVLNKVAVDTANYVGSGGQGQKPLFVTNFWQYAENVGDAAAGAYLENFAANLADSSSCDKKKVSCKDACVEDYSVDFLTCSNGCDNICSSAETNASEKSSCKKTCDNNFENAKNLVVNSTDYVMVDGMAQRNPDPVAIAAASNKRNDCYSGCDRSYGNASGSISGSSLATPSFNVCQPSSIDAKLKITLGLANQSRTQGPDCNASDIIKNWGNLDNYGNSVKALKDLYDSTKGGYNDQLFLSDIKGIFDPAGNDLSIYLTAKTDSAQKAAAEKDKGKTTLIGKGGWLDSLTIGGTSKGLPNQAEINAKGNYDQYAKSFGTYTGDAFVDALNTFLSQTAFTAFNTLMQNLGKTATQGSSTGSTQDFSNPNSNPSLGESAVKKETGKLNKPDYGSQTNYDILSQLAICQNKAQPGPTDCVIDNSFMQAIAEKKTVAEAISDKSLRGEWLLTKDNVDDAYTLRNISILRKYRVLPVGWEVAISLAAQQTNPPVTTMTLNDLVSCFDGNNGNDSFNTFSPNFKAGAWCEGLVDPNWVLKAPLNSCLKEGIGGQILGEPTVSAGIPASNGQPAILSTYSITRADGYCADSQTCIKENNNGSCDAYGYCSEEKRTWDFGSDSCSPINNTCKNFSGGTDNKSAAYLENTLDYSYCSASSAGCRQYSLNGTYNNNAVVWDAAKSVYFNSSALFTTCDQTSEGCTGLLRVNTLSGTNLVINSDFSADNVGDTITKGALLNSWPLYGAGGIWKATIVDAQSDPMVNSRAIKVEATGSAGPRTTAGIVSNDSNSLVPSNLQIIPGQAYTLSADVLLVTGDAIQANIGYDDNLIASEITTKNSWQRISVTRSPVTSFTRPTFFVGAYGTSGQVTAYIRNVKFEANNVANNYSPYGSSKIYEKLLPNYLEKLCYVDSVSPTKNYSFVSPTPAICKQFARKCNQDEAGCELYKSDNSSFSVAAKISSTDLCPKECLNYDVYISRQSAFNSAQKENLIPATAKKCSIEAAGCNEFTNLDSLAQGGEQKEYYTELKQCIKPSTSDCSAFYAWEGTDNGYQLKSYSLKKGANGGPAVTSSDTLACNSITYHSSVSSPSYNSDCLEFYNAAGQVTYHLLAKTITCSDDCHPYRLTAINVDSSITQSSGCVGTDKNWDVQNNDCQVCLNGGVYDTNQKACIYQAIPSEGKTCNSASNGCREYNGSNGENVRLISASDFESSNMWASNCANGTNLSSIANTNNGHSLKYNNNASACQPIGGSGQSSKAPLITQIFASDGVGATLRVGQAARQGSAYSINFIARADQNTNIKIYLYNPETKAASYFNGASGVAVGGGNEWQVYRANLENLDHVVSNDEILVLSANNDFYFDNFVINEISQRYYLIKNSSQVPVSCSWDNFGVYQGPDYNLGCRQYSDRANVKHNLRQFSKLCAESGVGCEQMIDTKNSSQGGAGIWNDTNHSKICDAGDTDCVSVSRDSAIYAVYDQSKQCGSSDAGCSRLGQATKVQGSTFWTDVFKKNNPDNYSSILCDHNSVGCEKWTDDQGANYTFKDPGLNTCVYRGTKASTIKNWYKSPVKRCDSNGNKQIDASTETTICLQDTDCSSGVKCIADTSDYLCSITNLKTLGLGGQGNQVPVPNGATGLCEAKESTCTEYIDPVSSFIPNLVYNPSYQLSGNIREGWVGGSQIINLEANKLYIFTVEGAVAGITSLSFKNDVIPLQNTNPIYNNTLGTGVKNLATSAVYQPQMFYTGLSNNTVNTVTVSGAAVGKTIIVKPAIIDYQLQNNIDATTCNGLVNVDNGCILFNERSMNSSSTPISLDKAAYKVNPTKTPVNCSSNVAGDCNANKLIKVTPNRTCAKWLSCVSYVKDANSITPTCYAVGECDRLSDDNKECANFVGTANTNARVFDVTVDKNASGYSLMNKYYFSQMKEVGSNSDFHYDFEDLVPYLSCTQEGTNALCNFPSNSNAAKEYLIREKVKGGADYPAHGKTYLKVPSGKLISPQIPGTGVSLLASSTYYINFLVNTHNAGVGGKIYIKARDRRNNAAKFVTIATSNTLTANNGWERKIIEFKTNDSDSIYRVEMGSDIPGQNGSVYFDDLNIEPVLNTAPNQYIARECRLYPETGSLTCGDSLAKDGLEGYCLEHDLKNPGVCSLWYPVDHINSATTGKAMNGYNGIAPLSYCNQVNGNFDLVEKRVSHYLSVDYQWDKKDACTNHGGNYTSGFYPNRDDCMKAGYPKDEYVMVNFQYPDTTESDASRCAYVNYCVPRQKGAKLKFLSPVSKFWYEFTQPDTETSTGIIMSVGGQVKATDDMFGYSIIDSASDGWYKYNGIVSAEKDSANPEVRVYNYSKGTNQEESDLEFIAGADPEKNFRLACDSFTQVVDSLGNNKAWSNRVSSASIYPTTTPAFFLQQNGDWYGGNLGLVEKRISHHVKSDYSEHYAEGCDGGNSTDGFNYKDTPNTCFGTCDSFGYPSQDYVDFYYEYTTQDSLGVNNGCQGEYWCVPKLSGAKSTSSYGDTYSDIQDISSGGPSLLIPSSVSAEGIKSTSDGWYLYNGLTVAEANNASPAIRLYDYAIKPTTESGLKLLSGSGTYMLSRYGRNRQGVPFGAAVLPDNLDILGSEGGAVKFRDQYSTKQNETIFAGRPYGCSGNGCVNIGACSLNPDVYCLVDPESLNSTINLNRETCNNGGYGVCVPLWYKSLSGALANGADYRQILKTLFLKSYTSYSFGAFGYVANVYNYDPGISACTGSRGADNQLSSYCANYPIVSNVTLKLNGQVVTYVGKRGMYSLEFNTTIDKEQEPLKELQIDWGDGNQQVITGQDSRPSGSTPHSFYHYYNRTDVQRINIKAIDNWDFWKDRYLNVGS